MATPKFPTHALPYGTKPTPAQLRRRKAEIRARDERIEKRNTANHERLAFAIAEAIKQDPRIEYEIVRSWLERNGYVVEFKADADARLARLVAQPAKGKR